MQFKKVIFAVDLIEPCMAVLDRAALMSAHDDIDIRLATAIPDLRALYHGAEDATQRKFSESLAAKAQDELNDLAAGAGIRSGQTVVLRGDADQAISRHAREFGADLVVFGNQDRHGLDHFVGGTGLGLLYRAPCDLLAVHPATPEAHLRRPLIALADDPEDIALMQAVHRHFPGPNLRGVHVLRPPWTECVSTRREVEALHEQMVVAARARLAAALGDQVPDALALRFGAPSDQIVDHARSQPVDVIVLGSGQHSLMGWHLGSTAHNVLTRTAHDVLLVRPARQPEPA